MPRHAEANATVPIKEDEKDEEKRATVEIWKYILGFTEIAVVKCAIELGIAEAIESHHEASISLSDLSSKLNCSPSSLYRIMRFLVHRRIFRLNIDTGTYSQTLLSRLLLTKGDTSMAALILLEASPAMLSPWQNLSAHVIAGGALPFTAAHGKDVWHYAAANPEHSRLINEAMACDARVSVAAIVEYCPDVFDGVRTVVDVGGGNGTALSLLVKAFPWITGINFDLPHVISTASTTQPCEGVEHVGGDMFEGVPRADAAFIMKVLHDWSDGDCIRILKNCREAVKDSMKGKVIMVEAVIHEDDEGGGGVEEEDDERLRDVRLGIDMVMMAHTNEGKERTRKEWAYVLDQAGFRRFTVKPTGYVHSVIEAFLSC